MKSIKSKRSSWWGGEDSPFDFKNNNNSGQFFDLEASSQALDDEQKIPDINLTDFHLRRSNY